VSRIRRAPCTGNARRADERRHGAGRDRSAAPWQGICVLPRGMHRKSIRIPRRNAMRNRMSRSSNGRSTGAGRRRRSTGARRGRSTGTRRAVGRRGTRRSTGRRSQGRRNQPRTASGRFASRGRGGRSSGRGRASRRSSGRSAGRSSGRSGGRSRGGRRYGPGASRSVESAMRRRKSGTLRSGRGGRGGRVTNPKQAIAIGLSEAREKGDKVPPPRGHGSSESHSASTS
jgi:hypothetical protein